MSPASRAGRLAAECRFFACSGMLDDSTAEGNMDLANLQKSDRIRALKNLS